MSRANRLDDAVPETNVAGIFSPWHRWEERTAIPDGHGGFASEYRGIYLLAHFDRAPAVGADPLADEIVYVGETGRTLGKRWKEFEQSARHGKPGHSGGHSYRAWAKEHQARWDTLHVAAYPIWFDREGDTDDPLSLAKRFRLFLEQRLLLDLVAHRRGRPGLHLLNRK